jgi:hypothetical protein
MELRPIRSGRQVLRFVTDRRPTHAGVDPYNLYIDRNSGDNVAPGRTEGGALRVLLSDQRAAVTALLVQTRASRDYLIEIKGTSGVRLSFNSISWVLMF